jgi:hypothetical protein
MEGLGVTRATDAERWMSASELAALTTCILCFLRASSVPDERELEELVFGRTRNGATDSGMCHWRHRTAIAEAPTACIR